MLWHEHLRRSLKLLVVGTLHYSGALGMARRRIMRNKAVILMYHRVTPPDVGVPDYSPTGMSVTPREFDMQMRFLRNNYDVVSLSKVVAAARGEQPFDANMCAITFDDGWADVYEYAFPILRQHGLPATVYLTTGFVDEAAWFWEERAKYLLALFQQAAHSGALAPGKRAELRDRLSRFGLEEVVTLRRRNLPAYLLDKGRWMRDLEATRRDELVAELEVLSRELVPDAPRGFLSWSEIREMADSGIQFENHTACHVALSGVGPDTITSEVQSATKRIKDEIGHTTQQFAYPYGKFDERVRGAIKNLGFASATTTRLGLVEEGSDPYSLHRVNMCSDIAGLEPLFAARILGV